MIHPYIVSSKKVCASSSVIRGTRIRAIDIAIEYDILGMTPDEIVDAHPHLNISQVHNALSYYYENKTFLDERLDANLRRIEELKKKIQKSSKLMDRMI